MHDHSPISAITHPKLQMSNFVVILPPNNNSGGLYHMVTMFVGVIPDIGIGTSRLKPKSQSLTCGCDISVINIFCGLMSRCNIALEWR